MAEKDYQWLPQNSTNDYVSVYPVGSAIILDTASRVIYFQLALAVTHLVSVIDIDKSCECTTLILENDLILLIVLQFYLIPTPLVYHNS